MRHATTTFGLSVERRRPRLKTPVPLARAVDTYLDAALPRDACWRRVPDQPDPDSGYVVIFHRRRAFCLEIKPGVGPLSSMQRASHAKLQDAGIPVEVARSLADVKRALRQFDIPQKEVA